jgi:hypothetical protein
MQQILLHACPVLLARFSGLEVGIARDHDERQIA